MLPLSFAFPLLLATATTTAANAFFDPFENVHRVSLLNDRSPFTSTDAALGIVARQLNGTGAGEGTCSSLQEECSASQGGGCCPFLESCCGTGCCPKYYSCVIDENEEKPCECYGSLCSDGDDGGDGGSDGDGSSSSSSSGDDDSGSSSSSSSSSGGENAGERLSSIGIGMTMVIAGLAVAGVAR